MLTAKQAFDLLEVTPRDGQLEVCEEVLSLLSRGKRYVFVDAPTGTGKSIIAMVVAAAVKMSVVSSVTNSLVRQYERDFGRRPGVVPMFGAENYPCTLRTEITKADVTADRCYRKSRFFAKLNGTDLAKQHCDQCAFLDSRKRKTIEPVVITNYSYFAVDRLFLEAINETGDVPTFGNRDLFVFDEGHLVNEQFSAHCAIFTSRQRIDGYLKDLRRLNDGEESQAEKAFRGAFDILLENVRRETIGPKNAEKFLGTLLKFYSLMFNVCTNKARESEDEDEYDKFYELGDKYRRHLCKVEDFFKYKFEVAVTCDPKEESVAVKPVFIGETFKHLEAPMNLFLSATMDADFLIETLKLDRNLCGGVVVPYRFERTDKTIRIPPKPAMVSLNWKTAKDDTVLARAARVCNSALEQHRAESGIVVVTSFALGQEIARRLSGSGHRVMLHRPGEKAAKVIDQFKSTVGPTVLVSPSLFEGVDLPGDQSKFQIMVKAPFYSLGDRRISYIMHHYPGAYERMTVMRLVQGLGRSTRFKGDSCVSYFVDSNLLRVFDSNHNRWKGQFNVERDWVG